MILLKKSLMENFSFVQCVVNYLRYPTYLMCLSVLRAYLLYVHTCLTCLCVFMPLPLTYFFFTCFRCHHFLRALPAFLFYILYVPIFFYVLYVSSPLKCFMCLHSFANFMFYGTYVPFFLHSFNFWVPSVFYVPTFY